MRALARWIVAVVLGATLGSSRVAGQGIESEIAAVVSLWQNPPSDSGALEDLVVQSATLRDARVLAALQAAAQYASNPTSVRIAALRAAFTFAAGRASALPSAAELSSDSLELAGGGSGIVGIAGAQPVTGTALSALESAMRSLSASDPSAEVRASAARVLWFARSAAAPKPQLDYVCGRKFRLRNSSDLNVIVEYSLSGTSETGQVTVAGRQPGATHQDTFFSTDNYASVTAYALSGEIIGSAANARIPCP
jgi:hypothetical protein